MKLTQDGAGGAIITFKTKEQSTTRPGAGRS